jgi:hypothetical protein
VNLKNVLKICKQLAKRLRLQLFLTISARFPQRQWSRNRTFYFSKKPRKIREKILKEKAFFFLKSIKQFLLQLAISDIEPCSVKSSRSKF